MKQLNQRCCHQVSGGSNQNDILGTIATLMLSGVFGVVSYHFGSGVAQDLMSGQKQAIQNDIGFLKTQANALNQQANALISNFKPAAQVAVTQIK